MLQLAISLNVNKFLSKYYVITVIKHFATLGGPTYSLLKPSFGNITFIFNYFKIERLQNLASTFKILGAIYIHTNNSFKNTKCHPIAKNNLFCVTQCHKRVQLYSV